MTKADRIELDQRLGQLDYWTRLSITNALDMKVTTKKKELDNLRNGVYR